MKMNPNAFDGRLAAADAELGLAQDEVSALELDALEGVPGSGALVAAVRKRLSDALSAVDSLTRAKATAIKRDDAEKAAQVASEHEARAVLRASLARKAIEASTELEARAVALLAAESKLAALCSQLGDTGLNGWIRTEISPAAIGNSLRLHMFKSGASWAGSAGLVHRDDVPTISDRVRGLMAEAVRGAQ